MIRALLLVLALTLAAPETALLHDVNGARTRRGIHGLSVGLRLSRYAERHAHAMADAGYIFHSSLDVPGDWQMLGENVGVGAAVSSVFEAFMRSSEHRANILRRRFDHVGVGVVRQDGSAWVVLVFGDR